MVLLHFLHSGRCSHPLLSKHGGSPSFRLSLLLSPLQSMRKAITRSPCSENDPHSRHSLPFSFETLAISRHADHHTSVLNMLFPLPETLSLPLHNCSRPLKPAQCPIAVTAFHQPRRSSHPFHCGPSAASLYRSHQALLCVPSFPTNLSAPGSQGL